MHSSAVFGDSILYCGGFFKVNYSNYLRNTEITHIFITYKFLFHTKLCCARSSLLFMAR